MGSKRANFEEVFGANPWLWLIPVRADPSSTGFEDHLRREHHLRREMEDMESGRLLDEHGLTTDSESLSPTNS